MERHVRSRWILGLALLIAGGTARADDAVELRPRERVGDSSRVAVELRASGSFLQAAPASASTDPKAKTAKPAPEPTRLALDVAMKLEFDEKLLAVGEDGGATKSVRHVSRASSAINGQVRPMSASIRPEVSLLVAQESPQRGLVVFSPGGPLLRSELEVVQGPADPLQLDALLPGKTLKVGDEWNLSNDAAKSLTGYDALATNGLVARVDSADAAAAECSFKGTVRGAVLGGEGTMECAGTFRFDRERGRIAKLRVERSEVRKPGQIEAGLDVKSTLSVERVPADAPPELAASTLEKIRLDLEPSAELLSFRSPDGKYTLLHDRDWHIAWDSDRLSVLKRLDRGGDLVAQCNLQRGPNLGKGNRQSPTQFRNELRKGLGERFVAILGEGEIESTAERGSAYKITVQGREGEVGVLWYYYLLASPEGEQMLATFTLGLSQQKTLGNGDLQLIGSLDWISASESTSR
ncbi:MAG: hypothetical protein SFX72_09950 [Isosphaeraceae bacterium]|nr:hypothetical protein [Isosphaeraceae bacterium]